MVQEYLPALGGHAALNELAQARLQPGGGVTGQ
jgi:hypothetical protein